MSQLHSIIAPFLVHSFQPPTSPPEPLQVDPPTRSSRTHSSTRSCSNTYSPPQLLVKPSGDPRPPTLSHSGLSPQLGCHTSCMDSSHLHLPSQFAHVDSQHGSSPTGNGIFPSQQHGHGRLSMFCSPSTNLSSYVYNSPTITSLVTVITIHAPTRCHPYAHCMTTQIGGSLAKIALVDT